MLNVRNKFTEGWNLIRLELVLVFASLFWALNSPHVLGEPVLQTILYDKPSSAITTCPLSIQSGGGATVRCIKIQGQTAAACAGCSNSGGNINGGVSHTIPSGTPIIQYSLDAINNTGGIQYCRTGACGGSNGTIKITLYSDSDCSSQICTTDCGQNATCSDNSHYTACPSLRLTCS